MRQFAVVHLNMVRLDTPLAKTIERRLLATLKASKDWQMTFPDLVTAAKCARWMELCKHVLGWMEYRRLVRSCGYNSYELVLTGEQVYRAHLKELLVRARGEVFRLKDLLKRQRQDANLAWPVGYDSYGKTVAQDN